MPKTVDCSVPLRNAKYEAFCFNVVAGKTLTLAYKDAGFAGDRRNAAELAKRDYITRRIAEITRQRQDIARRAAQSYEAKHTITREWVLDRLRHVAESAIADNDRPAANRSLELLGREIGMFIERKEIGRPGDFAALDTAQAVLDAVRAELGDAAAGAIAGLFEKPSDDNVIDLTPTPTDDKPSVALKSDTKPSRRR
jgi:phage terminase small subunit